MCPHMQAQYIFIHDALDELITCGETDISAAGLRVKVNRLRKVVPGKGITGFAEQFQVEMIIKLGLVLQPLSAACHIPLYLLKVCCEIDFN